MVNSDPRRLLSIPQNGEVCTVDASSCSVSSRVSHFESGHYFHELSMVALMGDAFCVIFRAPPVVPELSASFSSFRVLTTVSARGLQWVSMRYAGVVHDVVHSSQDFQDLCALYLWDQ